MGKNYFTSEQVEEIRKNKYIKHVSEKAITYTEEFKEFFIIEYNKGKLPSQILLEMGLNPKILGKKRVDGIVATIKRQSASPTGFKDKRADSSGRPRTRDLTQEELIERQKQEIELLKAKVEYLSLLRRAKREASWKAKSKKKKSSK